MKKILRNRKLILVLLLLVISAIATSLVIFGKYYATTNNKGVSVASGLYFASNVLSHSAGTTNTEQAKDDESIPMYYNPNVWVGETYTFPVQIRNYDSILLYNDANLDIEYNVIFILLDEDNTLSYSVKQITSDGPTIIEKPIVYGETVTFVGKLEGGQPVSDKYEVSIKIEDSEEFKGKSGRVLVVAYPTAPDYIATTAQSLRLASIIKGDYTQPEIKIDKSEFVIKDLMTDANWKEKVSSYSGYEYNITTNGDMAGAGSDYVAQSIKITWSNVLTINQFDSYYLEAKAAGRVEVDDVNNTTSMYIDAKPYANILITFFKKDADYDFATLAGMNEFLGLVTTELINN